MTAEQKSRKLARALADRLEQVLESGDDALMREIEGLSDADVMSELEALGADIDGFENRVREVLEPRAAILSPSDVERFVKDRDFQLTHEQQRELFKNSSLREIFRKEKKSRSRLAMPMAAAAASAEPVSRRPISGGWISLIPSASDRSIVNLVLELEEPRFWSNAAMLVEDSRLGIFKLNLVSLEGDQFFQQELDMRNPIENSVIEALQSSQSEADVVEY